jgi:EmrB/QacA subfamily drug resistance transporter
MKPPCDEAVIASRIATSPCRRETGTWVLGATILASSMAFIDGTVVNVALPALQTSFGATVVDVQWVVESYGLTLAALILVGGSMGDLFGRRRMFLAGVVVFAIASIACGMASNIQQLILARAAEGVGAAFLVPGSLSLISASFEEKERGRAIGTWSGSTAITTAIGPIVGGWLIEHLSWRWTFLINVPLAAVVVAVTLWGVPESSSNRRGRIDWWGALMASLGLGGLVFGFIESAQLGWRNPFVEVSLFVGIGCLIGFFFVEAREASPMIPLGLFQSRDFSGANLLTVLLYAAIGTFFFLLPLDLIQVQGYSATEAGAAVVPLILLIFLLSRWSGGLVARYGARLPLTIGPLIAALGFFLFSIPSIGGSYWRTFFPAVVVLGFGMAVSVAPLTTVVMGSIEADRAGTASGINNALARVAGLLAIAVFGVVMVAGFGNHLNRALSRLSMPDSARSELQSNETKLAALKAPAGVDPATATAIESSIAASFVLSFRLIMWICAALAVGSAVAAWRMILGSTQPAPAPAHRLSTA